MNNKMFFFNKKRLFYFNLLNRKLLIIIISDKKNNFSMLKVFCNICLVAVGILFLYALYKLLFILLWKNNMAFFIILFKYVIYNDTFRLYFTLMSLLKNIINS